MDNKTTGTRKPFLKPASFHSFQSQTNNDEQNGSSSENGSSACLSINNPFLKCDKEEPEVTKLDEKNDEHEKDPAKQTNNLFKPANNLFANAASSALENSNFVFGQRLRERVVMENINSTSEAGNEDAAEKKEDTHLFSSAITSSKSAEKDNSNDENLKCESGSQAVLDEKDKEECKESAETIPSDNNLSLVEAARKYEEMRGAQKRKYEEVEITTGEEDERNILEISCKLFTFIENNYEERGRGILRLNDSKSSSHSRVVFRASGSFRLLLNTKVWRDQICEQPSPKSLRLTAFDTNGVIKIYLVMGRVDDMSLLYRALSSRIRKEKERTPESVEEPAQLDETKEDGVDEPVPKRPATSD